jgi:hypothetical protein
MTMLNHNTTTFFNAIAFGILTIIIGYIGGLLAKFVAVVPPIPSECRNWNKNHTMEWSLFFTGFMLFYVKMNMFVRDANTI